jgi:hypothetical protein
MGCGHSRFMNTRPSPMPRNGALIFGDITGKLDLLRIECAKCGRAGRYRVGRLIAARGADASLIEWRLELTADCPRRIADNFNDQCAAVCPDLSRVFRLGSAPCFLFLRPRFQKCAILLTGRPSYKGAACE